MPKTSFEKAIEKQIKESKRQEQRQKQENRRLERQRKRETEKKIQIQQRTDNALSIVSASTRIGDMTIMNETYEIMLKILLDKYTGNIDEPINENISIFPTNIQSDIKLNFEVLKDYGMIFNWHLYINGNFSLYLSYEAINYFNNKKKAEENKQKNYIQIENLNANGSNVVLGDLFNSSLSIDNSIQSIENEIREKGGDDKEELLALFEEVKDYAENIQNCRSVTKNRNLLSKLKEHVSKNSWFYAEVVAFLGEVVLKTMG